MIESTSVAAAASALYASPLDDASAALLGPALLQVLGAIGACMTVKEAASGRYVRVDRGLEQVLGRPVDATVGATDTEIFSGARGEALHNGDLVALSQSEPYVSELRLECDGRRRDFKLVRCAVASGIEGTARYVLTAWIDQTEALQREAQLRLTLEQLEQSQVAAETQRRELQDQALRDGLTGLYQRAHFEDHLRRELDLSSREHREFALVSIAVDPPKDVVKALGDEARTRILEALGRLLRSNTRAMDASCRLQGDHFAVLLSGVGLATAHSRMEGLRRQCATQIVVLEGRELGFTVSMGVASFPHTAHGEPQLIEAAERALVEAQRRGGNHVALASIRFAPAA